jgi:origin recognition complex subunit 4
MDMRRNLINFLVRILQPLDLYLISSIPDIGPFVELVIQTVTTGGSNSVLLLGPRGVGKSHLVDLVLEKAKTDSNVFKKDGLIVKLHGLVETDDKLALKQIARQLKLENVQGDRVFGSFAEHLEFLLKCLRSGDHHSKPVVFVLEEFHLFCSHHNQTLLYNLFDVAQSRATPMIVIGVSPELDVLESLEKRVRSRYMTNYFISSYLIPKII